MSDPNESLRNRALAMLKASAGDVQRIPPEDVSKLLYELQVHQMELEIQNEELRQAQIELAHARDSYSDLYEFAPVGYLTLDRRGVIQKANLMAATMLDVERIQLVGRKFSDFVSDESQDVWHLHRREVFAEPRTAACELRAISQKGVSASLSLQSLSFPDEQGRLSQCRMALVDDSQRKIAFDALKTLNIDLDASLCDTSNQLDHSIEQLRLMSETVAHLGEGVMITGDDLDWPGPEIIFVNDAMCEIAGYQAGELIGKSPRILQGGFTDPVAVKQMRRDLEKDGSCRVELVNHRKDGTPYDVEIFIMALFDATGKRANFVSIQRDITQRKHVAEELRRELDFSANIINTTQSVLLVLDTEGKIVQFNPYLEKLTGWRFDEVRGRDWFEKFVPLADREVSKRFIQTVEAGDLRTGSVSPILAKDGGMRFIEWYDSPLTDADGRLLGLLRSGQDVTQRRELESFIVDIASEERRRIGTDLHDGVGQELTGLMMIVDSLSVALKRASRPEVKIAEKLKAGLKRALAQVRTLSRSMNPVNIDAEGLMSALSEMSTQIEELTGIQCSFRYDQPVLLWDNETATQLFRIAQEATTNSIRHGQADEITISLEQFENQVVLRIRDNGCGIDPNDPPTSGMGLRTMAYRAHVIQGELDVHPLNDGGTEVSCKVSAKA
jgi:PAS domain S-box-containing protein